MINLTTGEIESICNQLRLLVAEFGSSNVIVAVPTAWRGLTEKSQLAEVDLVFTTEKHVLLRASACGGAVEYQYVVA